MCYVLCGGFCVVRLDAELSRCSLCWAPNVCVLHAQALLPDITAPTGLCETEGRLATWWRVIDLFISVSAANLTVSLSLCEAWTCLTSYMNHWRGRCCHWHSAHHSVSIPAGSSVPGHCGESERLLGSHHVLQPVNTWTNYVTCCCAEFVIQRKGGCNTMWLAISCLSHKGYNVQ